MTITIQVPSIILPTVAPLGTETEAIDDLVEHTSLEFLVENLQEKTIHILATEAVAFGVPGNLLCWVELSPYPSTIFAGPPGVGYWSAIGGGGGVLVPLTPIIEVATGVNLTAHTINIAWNIHSRYARLVIQTPVAAALPWAFWGVQAIFEGRT